MWTAEAYGSDAITPLAYIAARTDRIRLGTGIMQLAGRPPAMCAMQCMTVDALAGGGRMIAGLGVSGPQIVEGWYGQPWGSPYWRLRDYIEIMRKIFEREQPVSHQGREISLPYTGPGATGLGKPLRSILHSNPALPIWLGSGKEATVRLARAAGRDKGWHNFETQAQVAVRMNASRSSTSPAARTKRSRPCPTSTSMNAASSDPRRASAAS